MLGLDHWATVRTVVGNTNLSTLLLYSTTQSLLFFQHPFWLNYSTSLFNGGPAAPTTLLKICQSKIFAVSSASACMCDVSQRVCPKRDYETENGRARPAHDQLNRRWLNLPRLAHKRSRTGRGSLATGLRRITCLIGFRLERLCDCLESVDCGFRIYSSLELESQVSAIL